MDVISDVNLPYSEPARKYLHEMGMPKERIYVTGSPMAEVLRGNLDKIEASDVLNRLGLQPDKYILLSAHREENIDTDKNFTSLFNAINALAEKYDMPILYSCHPRSRKKLETSGFKLDPRVRVNEPLGFNDYNKLQMNALAIVSDSGTLPEESSFYLSIGHSIAAVCIGIRQLYSGRDYDTGTSAGDRYGNQYEAEGHLRKALPRLCRRNGIYESRENHSGICECRE